LLHPGKLVRAMIDVLPNNVYLYENSSLLNWNKNDDVITCNFKNGKIKAKKIIFATNGFLKSLELNQTIIFQLH
jgi:glycine/D-amino acid oxidase-like deaminating enzyme